MLTNIEKILFAVLFIAANGAGAFTFWKMFQVINRGQGKINWLELVDRAMQGIGALFSQGRIIRHRTWSSIFHYMVAYAFIFFLIVNVVDIAEGYLPPPEEGEHLIPGIIGDVYRLLADVLSVLGIVGVIYFLLRRFVARDEALRARENVLLHPKARKGGISRDSLIVGLFIVFHLGARYFGASFLVAQHSDPWQPFATLLSGAWSGMSASSLDLGWHISWWIALGLILIFLPYFPFTKHAHLFMGPLNWATRPERTSLGEMSSIDFEDESIEQFGVSTLFDLHQTAIVDAFSCIMCNRCQEVCPAYVTGKELSPAAIEINKRYRIRENLFNLAAGAEETEPMLDWALTESALWACTSCGACIDICPVGNEPMHDILEIRRDKVLMQSEFPNELKQAFTGMERLANPWNSTESRMAWTEGLEFDVPTVEENPDYEYLFWVGCAGAFDPDAQDVARSVATILHHADVSFAILGEAESCTGDSARRAGNEYLFYEMAMANIETLNEFKANERKIVASCPHCFHTLGKEYGAYGGHYEVFHHTQLLADLVGKGKLHLNGKTLSKVTYHDPCYLGRHNGEYEAPRDTLAYSGMILMEMDRNRSDSFCCGAGGAQMWKEEEHGSENVNVNRFQEAKATGAETVAVGCPFCAVMMRDANTKDNESMQVKDVAQVLVEAIDTEHDHAHHEHGHH